VLSVVGAPLFAHFAVCVRGSASVETLFHGERISSPAVDFFSSSTDPGIPDLPHLIYLTTVPASPTLTPQYLDLSPLLHLPTTVGGGGSLFFTANSMTLTEGTESISGSMMVDCGAQASIVSRIMALELDLPLESPDFEVEVQGVGGLDTAPGFYIDRMRIPAEGGAIVWSNAPVVAINLPSPDAFDPNPMFGVLGINLLAYRDWVFNAIHASPHLAVSGPIVPPRLRLNAARRKTGDVLSLDWLNEPAPPALVLESCTNLTAETVDWQSIATAELATVEGTFTVTAEVDRLYFRLRAPTE